jgi:hypothetical protein
MKREGEGARGRGGVEMKNAKPRMQNAKLKTVVSDGARGR